MNNIFDNVKVFAVTAVLFAIATLATAGDVTIHTGLTVTPLAQPAETGDATGTQTAKLGPTMPPDPWTDDGK
jgi:hypothetical protein